MISILLDRIVNGAVAETIDLTRKLDDQSRLQIRNELERDTFDLVVPDVELKLSDLDESLYNKFFNEPITTVWKLHIFNNGAAKFRGFINTDFVRRDMTGEYVSITSFSTMKRFWEVAETIKMTSGTPNVVEYSTGYYSFLDFIKGYITWSAFGQNFILQSADFDRSIVIRGTTLLQTGTRKAAVTVDFSLSGWIGFVPQTYSNGDPTWIGNRVRIGYLHGTLKELLLAVAKHNNMEWYIDPETETLKLGYRNAIRTDLGKDLSDKVIDSDNIEVSFSDEKRYDYVSTIAPVNESNIPALNTVIVLPLPGADVIHLDKPGRPCGIYEYVLASVDAYGNILSCGQILTVNTPIVMPVIQPGLDPPTVFRLCSISLTIPALTGLPDVKSRRLYRTCRAAVGGGLDEKAYNGNYLFVAEFEGNASTVFVDAESEWETLKRMMESTPENGTTLDVAKTFSSLSILIRYDESTGTWMTPIFNTDSDQPEGSIFDTKVDLSFGDYVSGETHKATLEEIFWFFGGVADYPTLQIRWKDMMITKRRALLSMQGNDLNLGDAFTLQQITKLKGINSVVVKNAVDDLIKEESQLTLINI